MPAPPPRRIVQALLSTPKGGRLPAGLLGSQGSMSKYTPTMREKIAGLLAKNWYGDSREGYQNAERLVNVGDTVVPPLGLMTGMYDAGRAAGGGNMMQAGLIGGMAALPLPPAIKKGIRAYHGSPHSFDKFSMDKIGTGEGAQAYGHGLYFAEGEGVAKSYRDQLSGLANSKANRELQNAGGDVDAAIAAVQKKIEHYKTLASDPRGASFLQINQQSLADLQKLKAGGSLDTGHMYEVNIDADPEQFLDWDKPLSEQPASAQAILNKSGVAPTADVGSAISYAKSMRNPLEDQLKQAGIPGIKYLDAGSRAKGDGSRNYVVFDENLISIVRKYGIAGASTLLGYDLLSNVTTDQAEKLKQAERVY